MAAKLPPEKPSQPKNHLTLTQEIAVFLEKTRLAEYMDLMQRPHRLAWLSFWGGLWRGFGFGLGAVVLLAIFLWSLRVALHHAGGLPIIGTEVEEAISWLLNVIEKHQVRR
jgi:hypothetical protein